MNRTNDQVRETTDRTFTTLTIEEDPYPEEQGERGTFDAAIEDELGAPIEPEDEHRRVKQRRRRVALAGLAALLLLAIFGVAILYHRLPTRVDYGSATRQAEVLPPPPNVNTGSGRDFRTEKAIEEAQRLTVGKPAPDTITTSQTEITLAEPNSQARLDSPFTLPVSPNDEIDAAGDITDTGTTSDLGGKHNPSPSPANNDRGGVRSQRSSETSLYMSDQNDRSANKPVFVKDSPAKNLAETKPIAVPAFASMLPVRTLGALYTLRAGALVRLELTRETKGDGWSLKRGTILVGTSKGGEFDRAYVSLIGFIDPQSGKLVKLGGELLGGDGAAGLKGKRRQLDSGWARVLGRVSGAALDVTGAVLSGRSRDTVIISDGARTRMINPVTDEISGLLGSELDRRQGRSFVEVVAGTPGYVMVTDLPSVIEGIEPTPELNNDTLATLTDADATRSATGLTERELAELLANGSPEQIRAAMPRMTPEMRKIAAAVLRP